MRVIAELKADGVSDHLHLAPPERGEQCADRVGGAARRARGRRARSRRDPSPDAMIRLMIGRDLKSLYIPPAAPPGDVVLEIVEAVTAHLSRTAPSSLSVRARRDPRPGRAGRLRAHRACARRLRHRSAPRRRDQARRRADPHSPRRATAIDARDLSRPEDRKRSGLLLDVSITENISLPDLASYRALLAGRTPRARPRTRERQRERLNIKTPDVDDVGRLACPAATSRRSCSPNGCR